MHNVKFQRLFPLAAISIIFAVTFLFWRIGSSGFFPHVMESFSYHKQSVDHHLDEQGIFNEPRQSPREDVMKLLPHGNSCTCQSKPRHLLADDKGALNRREHQFHQYRARFFLLEHKLVVAQANFPLSYPTQGVLVHPLGTILIPGLSLQKKTTDLHNVTLRCEHGTLNTAMEVEDVQTEGLGTKRLVVASRNPIAINMQMKFISYTNTHYLLGDSEQVKLEYGGQIVEFLIRVQHPRLPTLHNSGTGNISELVTIITKTFLRYEKVQKLIASVRKFYTDVRIVVADDSEPWQNITGWKVDHYKMPFGVGWFAGRNLAVSQVTTKYLLWVDDDFIFTKDTKLEKFITVLEETTMDLVGGSVTGNTFRFKLKVSPEIEDGFCVKRLQGYYHDLQGFPGCVITDVVVNFFMAKTDRVRAVGFDPQLSRTAHTEFFIDGLGELQVASCDYVKIGHESQLKNPSMQRRYNSFRQVLNNIGFKTQALKNLAFKNRLTCKLW
uniref:beta-1,4 N-acetylgalactosaminyltransferase 1-like isoform X1 n=1 Tax=Myxine glutinosa TaxID=7769 RepID=UPI00358E5691